MAKLSLKETVLNLLHVVFGNKKIENDDVYFIELSETSILNYDTISEIYEIMKVWKKEKLKSEKDTYWTKAEETLLLMYSELQDELEPKPNAKMYNDLSEILQRPQGGIGFKFRALIKEDNDNNKRESINHEQQLFINNIEDGELNLLNLDDQNAPKNNIENDDVNHNNNDIIKTNLNIDLIDVMARLSMNLDTVGLNIDSFFLSLLEVSNKAVENSNEGKIKELEDKIEFAFKQLNNEKYEKEELQKKIKKTLNSKEALTEVINEFNSLPSVHKLQQLNDFTNRLKNILNNM